VLDWLLAELVLRLLKLAPLQGMQRRGGARM